MAQLAAMVLTVLLLCTSFINNSELNQPERKNNTMADLAPVTFNVTTGDLSYDNGAGLVAIPYTGPQGPQGNPGQGVPTGGTTGQVLAKIDGTNYNTQWVTPSAGGGTGSAVPMGRLTLTSGKPVMMADALNQTTVYYAPYVGDTAPIYDGTSFVSRQFTSSDTDAVGASLALDSNSGHTGYHQSGKLFDIFIYWDSTLCRIATGPAWSSDTARGTGAGTTELEKFKGLWVNKNSITLRYGSSSGDTASVAAREATYLGTMYAHANGQCSMAMRPTRVNGGSNNILGLWNAYNRKWVAAINQDLVSPNGYAAYASSAVRVFNNSNNNAITWIDGLGESFISSRFSTNTCNNGTANGAYTCGVGLDQNTNLAGGLLPQTAFQSSSNDGAPVIGSLKSYPLLGKHKVYALEQSTSVPMLYFGNDFGGLELELEM